MQQTVALLLHDLGYLLASHALVDQSLPIAIFRRLPSSIQSDPSVDIVRRLQGSLMVDIRQNHFTFHKSVYVAGELRRTRAKRQHGRHLRQI